MISFATQSKVESASTVTQSNSRPSWGYQFGKSVILSASSVGLGWLVNKLWTGTDTQEISSAGDDHQLVTYDREQKNHQWLRLESLSADSAQTYRLGRESETLFQRLGIAYQNGISFEYASPVISNFPVMSTCYLTASLLIGGNVQHHSLASTVVTLVMLSLPANVKAWSDDAIPVGSIIAYASDKLPEGYIRCDGSLRSIDKYPELFEVLKGHCEIDGDSFRVPNCQDFFLRGATSVAEIGKVFEDTTRMPRNKLKVLKEGEHVHTAASSGTHEHQLDTAGAHSHTLTEAGAHTHSISKNGRHSHNIRSSGEHQHTIYESGRHWHTMNWAGEHRHTIHGARSYPDQPRTWPNNDWHFLVNGMTDFPSPDVVQKEGGHTHETDWEGIHSHGMDEAGSHTHAIDEVDEHDHTVESEASHRHEASFEGSHSHKISFEGLHTHDIAKAGEHTHEIEGGDQETRPKNMKVAYLIKAKPTAVGSTGGSTVTTIIHDNSMRPQDFIMPLVTAVFSVMAVKYCK